MKKSLILCLIVGVSLGLYIFSRYDNNKLELVSKTVENNKKIYALQYGVYSNFENIEKIKIKNNYILNNNKYYVYVAYTTNKNNIEKLENYFNSLNINTYTKEIEVDYNFYETLSQYDLLLKEANSNESINKIVDAVITKYEELNENKRIAT